MLKSRAVFRFSVVASGLGALGLFACSSSAPSESSEHTASPLAVGEYFVECPEPFMTEVCDHTCTVTGGGVHGGSSSSSGGNLASVGIDAVSCSTTCSPCEAVTDGKPDPGFLGGPDAGWTCTVNGAVQDVEPPASLAGLGCTLGMAFSGPDGPNDEYDGGVAPMVTGYVWTCPSSIALPTYTESDGSTIPVLGLAPPCDPDTTSGAYITKSLETLPDGGQPPTCELVQLRDDSIYAGPCVGLPSAGWVNVVDWVLPTGVPCGSPINYVGGSCRGCL